MIKETLTSFSEKNITKKVSYVSFPLRRLRGGGHKGEGGWGRLLSFVSFQCSRKCAPKPGRVLFAETFTLGIIFEPSRLWHLLFIIDVCLLTELCSHTLPEQLPNHYQAQKNSNHIDTLSYLQGVLLALDESQSVTINLEIRLRKTAEVKWWRHFGNASKEWSLVLTFHFLPGVFEVGVNPDLKQLQTLSQPQLFLAWWSEPPSPQPVMAPTHNWVSLMTLFPQRDRPPDPDAFSALHGKLLEDELDFKWKLRSFWSAFESRTFCSVFAMKLC